MRRLIKKQITENDWNFRIIRQLNTVTMESPSAKLSAHFQTERKLRQATLPFEIMKISSKTDSPALKRQKLSNCDKVQEDNGIEIVEIVEENFVKDEKPASQTESSSQTEIVEIVVCEAVPKVQTGVPNSKTETDIKMQEDSSSSGVVLIENPEKVNLDDKVSKPMDEKKNVEDDNLKGNKRKFESSGIVKEQKPPKRAKLIYNIDKIRKHQAVSVSNVNSMNADCVNSNKIEEKLLNGSKNILSLESSVVSESVNATCNLDKSESDQLEEAKKVVANQAGAVTDEWTEKLIKENLSSTTSTSSSMNDTNNIENMDVDSSSSVELLTPVKSCEKSGEENCTSPSLKSEGCSPSGKNTVKQLTPKQLERKAEIAKRREEIQQEKERKKKEKDRMKQEKEEEKARLKQEKEEVKKKIREEKEKKRLAEIEMKNEEKRKKEEEKRKKEEEKLEEKRKKEEQKLEDKRKKEEMLKKKEEEQEMQKKKITKEAEAFSSFFKKYDSKTPTTREDDVLSNEVVFMPFAVRADMRLAPVNRNPMDEERRAKFEEFLQAQTAEIVYLQELRSGVIVPKKSGNTWPLEEKYGDVVVLDEGLDLKDEVAPEPEKKFNDRRPKLLQFNENRRPPYWGTWRKKSKNIRPRNPLGKDEIFDYEVDSDEEWEEEEPGESLHGSDDEKESEDEYEVDNDFFVPHGYLSDDENPEEETISPETQKAKLKLLGEQFDLERNEKTKLLKPILLGCLWFNGDSDEPASANPSVVRFLNKRKAIPWTENIPIPVLQDENTDPAEIALSDHGTPTSNKETLFPESAIPDLITLIHCSTNSRKNLAKTFLMQWNKKQEESTGESETSTSVLSQARIAKKIKELAKWEEFPEEGPFNGKLCWYVKKEVREKFGLADLSVQPKIDDASDSDPCKKVSPSLITKFTKVLTEDERRNQITKARKSLSASKPLMECIPTTPKQVTPLKCIQKLKDFWPKPSVISKYTPTASVDTDEVMIIDPEPKSECSEGPLENKITAETTANEESSKTEETPIPKEESPETEETPISKEEPPKTEETPTPSESNGSSSTCEVTQTPIGESKPVVKKRVAILFSAPRGCTIIKPEVPTKKPVASVDDIVKKYENSKMEEEISK